MRECCWVCGTGTGRGRGAGGAAHPAAVVFMPQRLGWRQVHVLHAGGLRHVPWQQVRRMVLMGRQAVSRCHHCVCLQAGMQATALQSTSCDCNNTSEKARRAMFG